MFFLKKRKKNYTKLLFLKTYLSYENYEHNRKKLKTKIKYRFKKIPKNECFKILGSKPKFLKRLNSYQSMIGSTVEWYFK